MPKLLYLAALDWYFWCHRMEHALAAQAEGYDVTVAAPDGSYRRRIEEAGLRFVPMPMVRQGRNPLEDLWTEANLIRLYRREKPDLVHHIAIKPVIYGTLAAKLTGVPAVVNAMSGMGYVFANEQLLSRTLRPGVKLMYKLLLASENTRMILQNQDDVSSWVTWRVLKRDRIVMIRGAGVDTKKFAPWPEPEGPPLVILPARLLRDKGVLEFVEAARRLKRRKVPSRFALVGEGDLGNPSSLTSADIEGWVKEGIVEHFGWRDDMARVHREAHVVCLPSYREGLPKALLEAAASGRPIVSTAVPGCKEIARGDQNALVVPPRDAAALTAALERIVTDPALRARLGKRSREIAVEEFSQERVIAQTIELYRKLLGSAPGARASVR